MNVDVFLYTSYQKLLSDELSERKKSNSLYSSRAFSRDLGISVSMLSRILNHKKGLSPAGAENVSANLELSSDEKDFFVALVRAQTEQNQSLKLESITHVFKHGKFKKREFLKDSTLSLLTNWYCLMVFNALEVKTLNGEPQKIANLLSISLDDVKSVLNVLIDHQIVERVEDRYEKIEPSIEFKSEVPSESIQAFHMSQLFKAQEMLIGSPLDQRYFSNVMFAFDEKYKDEINSKIKEFVSDLSKYNELGNPDSLVSFNVNSLYFTPKTSTDDENFEGEF